MSCNISFMLREHNLPDKYEAVFPLLDERQRRMIAAADALFLGRGGVSRIARASGLARTTIHRGIAELDQGSQTGTRTRQVGGGRKSAVEADSSLLDALEALVEPLTRGDPRPPCGGRVRVRGSWPLPSASRATPSVIRPWPASCMNWAIASKPMSKRSKAPRILTEINSSAISMPK